MRGRTLSICGLVAMVSGCYHVTVVTGLPESMTRSEEAFQMSYVVGLVPPPEINAEEVGCAQGVAKIETWHSFVNILIGGLSGNLITPISVSVTCAASGQGPDAATMDGKAPSAESERGATPPDDGGDPTTTLAGIGDPR